MRQELKTGINKWQLILILAHMSISDQEKQTLAWNTSSAHLVILNKVNKIIKAKFKVLMEKEKTLFLLSKYFVECLSDCNVSGVPDKPADLVLT